MQIHHLIRRTYPARSGAYLLCWLVLMICAGSMQGSVFLAILCLVYPHLVLAVQLRWFNHSVGARAAMLVDGFLVGLFLAWRGFDDWLVLALIHALIMSTLLIAPMRYLWGALTALAMGALAGYGWFGVFDFDGAALSLTAMLMTFVYGGFVARLGHQETRLLRHQTQLSHAQSYVARHEQQLVQPYLINHDGLRRASSRSFLTVFFSDLSGFTGLMDQLPEAQATAMINETRKTA